MKYLLKFLVLGLSGIIFSACEQSNDKILPEHRQLTESVYSSVVIQPDSLYQAFAMVSGILEHNLVEEGELVSTNQSIAEIKNETPKLNTQNARLSLELARENYSGSAAILESIKEEILAATLRYNNDSILFYKQQSLWDQNIGSKIDYDTKKLNFELSKNSLNTLQNKYDRTRKELLTVLRQAENNYQTSLINTKDFTVKSKINGKVYALYKERGELVNSLEPIASIGSATNFIVELLVDESDIVKIALDQAVIIKLDAYKDDIFKARVSKILPQKNMRNQSFKVEAVFDESPKVLYPGLSGEASVIISIGKSDALTIPKSYLINKDQVKTDDGLITIETGRENLEYIEIISGITKDTYIYNPQ